MTQDQLQTAKRALEQGRYDEATGLFNDLLQQDPENWDAMMGMASALWATGALADAEQYYIQAVEVEPQRVEGWKQLILLEKEGGATEAAADNLTAALRCLPGHQDLLELKRAEPVEPEDEQLLAALNRIRQLIFAGQLDKAFEVYQVLVAEAAGSHLVLVAQGELHLAAEYGEITAMIHDLTRATRQQPDAWEPLSMLGRLYLRKSPLQNQRMALALCEDAWRISAEHPRAGIGLIESWLAVGKNNFALALCRRLAKGTGMEAKMAQEFLAGK